MKTDLLEPKKSGNAFDALRVISALAVLYSHSFALYGLPEPQPVAGQLLGRLAVTLFFSISGYLICQSWERDPHLGRYAARRALRILPALWVVVILTALVIGALCTTAALSDYFGSSSPWRYMAVGVTAMGSPPLLGVFEQNPFPGSVNGSLWTLKYEIIMYLVLGLLGRFAPGSLRAKCSVAFVFFAASWLLICALGYQKAGVPFLWRFYIELYPYRIAYLGAFFFAGACAHLYFHRIHLSWAVALIMAAVLPFIKSEMLTMVMLWVAVPYIALVFALKAPPIFQKVNGFDYSYGIYVYAFPIQQIVSQMGQQHQWSWGTVLVLSLLSTTVAAALSWHYVEKPALRMKGAISAIGRTITPPAATAGSSSANRVEGEAT